MGSKVRTFGGNLSRVTMDSLYASSSAPGAPIYGNPGFSNASPLYTPFLADKSMNTHAMWEIFMHDIVNDLPGVVNFPEQALLDPPLPGQNNFALQRNNS
jgi:hypothetical protein